MQKKIKVQRRLNLAFAVFISLVAILLCGIFVYIVFAFDFASYHSRYKIYGFIGLIAVFIPLWLKNAQSDEEYVYDLIIDEESLTLVYKKQKEQRTETISFDDILSINAILKANNVKTAKSVSLFCETTVTIKRKNGKTIVFSENPTADFSLCAYAFILQLLAVAKSLPNFKYRVCGNSEVVKQDVKFYAIYGRRLPFLKRELIAFKQYPKIAQIILVCCFLPFIISVCFLIYLNFPVFLSDTDKQYVSHIEEGYKYYQNNMYDKSLLEYDRALNINDSDSTLYYYRALSYYYQKRYEKSAIEAQKGIDVLNKKSLYHYAKNWKFANNDIGLYTTLGDSERKLKNYQKAIDAYSYVVNKVKYTYTDIYFKRGKCELSLNQKDLALNDFYEHRHVIEKYLQDQLESEYKDMYPKYTEEDLEKIDKWIEKSK